MRIDRIGVPVCVCVCLNGFGRGMVLLFVGCVVLIACTVRVEYAGYKKREIKRM